jgi:hypothetical protein
MCALHRATIARSQAWEDAKRRPQGAIRAVPYTSVTASMSAVSLSPLTSVFRWTYMTSGLLDFRAQYSPIKRPVEGQNVRPLKKISTFPRMLW